MGKASTKAHNKYIAKAYDRINLTVPKGKKDTIQAHAEAQSESVNGFINRAIDQAIGQDRGKGPSEAVQAPHEVEVSLPLHTKRSRRPPRAPGKRSPSSSSGLCPSRRNGINRPWPWVSTRPPGAN